MDECFLEVWKWLSVFIVIFLSLLELSCRISNPGIMVFLDISISSQRACSSSRRSSLFISWHWTNRKYWLGEVRMENISDVSSSLHRTLGCLFFALLSAEPQGCLFRNALWSALSNKYLGEKKRKENFFPAPEKCMNG